MKRDDLSVVTVKITVFWSVALFILMDIYRGLNLHTTSIVMVDDKAAR